MAYDDGYFGGYGPSFTLGQFTAPTYSIAWLDETGHGHDPKYSLWRHYSPLLTVQTVVISGGIVTPRAGQTKTFTVDELAAADAGSGEGGKSIFRGQATHDVNDTEATLLMAAGYTVI